MIHTMYRKVYGDAPATVRAVTPGNASQRDAVAQHIDDISKSLHAHHQGEDLFLWDTLETRAPACAAHVSQMREQHEAVAAQLDVLDARVAGWKQDASAESRDAVAESLDAIHALLIAYLGQEERDIVPVAQVTMAQNEWDKLAEHGRSWAPPSRMLYSLGYILSSMSEEEGAAWMKANLPVPARLAWRLVGKRQFAAQEAAMRGA